MAQFDVYLNPNAETNHNIPYLVDVQADLLDVLATRIVIPLHTMTSMPKPARHLNPILEISGEKLVLSTSELAGIPTSILGKPIDSLKAYREDMITALDFVFTGI